MKEIYITTDELALNPDILTAGDKILLSGTVYTARDAAHKRLCALLEEGKPLPFNLDGAGIYYSGPTPTPEGLAIGSCGPTTSSRMDVFTPIMLMHGLKFMIGKGPRSSEVCESIKKHGAVYLCAIGGAGALYAKCVSDLEVIAFPDLGCESVKKLTLKDFPLICAIDSKGNNLFK